MMIKRNLIASLLFASSCFSTIAVANNELEKTMEAFIACGLAEDNSQKYLISEILEHLTPEQRGSLQMLMNSNDNEDIRANKFRKVIKKLKETGKFYRQAFGHARVFASDLGLLHPQTLKVKSLVVDGDDDFAGYILCRNPDGEGYKFKLKQKFDLSRVGALELSISNLGSLKHLAQALNDDPKAQKLTLNINSAISTKAGFNNLLKMIRVGRLNGLSFSTSVKDVAILEDFLDGLAGIKSAKLEEMDSRFPQIQLYSQHCKADVPENIKKHVTLYTVEDVLKDMSAPAAAAPAAPSVAAAYAITFVQKMARADDDLAARVEFLKGLSKYRASTLRSVVECTASLSDNQMNAKQRLALLTQIAEIRGSWRSDIVASVAATCDASTTADQKVMKLVNAHIDALRASYSSAAFDSFLDTYAKSDDDRKEQIANIIDFHRVCKYQPLAQVQASLAYKDAEMVGFMAKATIDQQKEFAQLIPVLMGEGNNIYAVKDMLKAHTPTDFLDALRHAAKLFHGDHDISARCGLVECLVLLTAEQRPAFAQFLSLMIERGGYDKFLLNSLSEEFLLFSAEKMAAAVKALSTVKTDHVKGDALKQLFTLFLTNAEESYEAMVSGIEAAGDKLVGVLPVLAELPEGHAPQVLVHLPVLCETGKNMSKWKFLNFIGVFGALAPEHFAEAAPKFINLFWDDLMPGFMMRLSQVDKTQFWPIIKNIIAGRTDDMTEDAYNAHAHAVIDRALSADSAHDDNDVADDKAKADDAAASAGGASAAAVAFDTASVVDLTAMMGDHLANMPGMEADEMDDLMGNVTDLLSQAEDQK